TFMTSTKGQSAFASGYVVLNCSQPVQAMAMYALISPQGQTLGMASVPSAPSASYATFPGLTGIGLQYGVAIANPSSAAISVEVGITQSGKYTSNTITIPSRGCFFVFLVILLIVGSF